MPANTSSRSRTAANSAKLDHVLKRNMIPIAVLFVGSVLAAENSAWFGTPPPKSMTDPKKPALGYQDFFPELTAQFTHRPGKHDELLDGAALKKDLRRVIDFSLESLNSGDKLWGRRATTPSFQHTLEWTVQEWKAAGLTDARLEPFPVTAAMWVPESWQVQLTGAGDPITLTSAFPQQGSATGTLTAPLVFVGRGTPADLAGRDLHGKVAVMHVRPEPSLFGSAEQGIPAQLVKRGAVAVVESVEGPGNVNYYDPRFGCQPAMCFMVGGQDGWFLEQVIGKAADTGALEQLKLSLSMRSSEKTGLTSGNAMATIPGQSAKRLIVNAHADGYFQGADDNASGMATLMALSRYFAKQPKPKHTLVFIASGGHHGPGNGPTALVAAHPEWKGNVLTIVNLEHLAYSDAVRGKVRSQDNFGMVWNTSVTEGAKSVGVTNLAPFTGSLWKEAPRCFGVTIYQQYARNVSGDLGGFAPLGVPMTQMIQSGTFYHTSGDVFEQVPEAGLERAARFYAYLVEQLDAAPEALIAGESVTGYTAPKPENCAAH
jgi:hypothetical protein